MSEELREDWCYIHNEQMNQVDGKYGKFWSHDSKDERYKKTGTKQLHYCNGKYPDGSEYVPGETKDIKTGTTHQGKYDTSQIRCKIWEIAWRVFSSDPEARKQCIEEAERYIFTGDLVDNEKPFEYEG